SGTLAEFIDHELVEERISRIADDPKIAVATISATFASPELVPFVLMQNLKPDELLEGLRSLLGFSDPFALTGAFEICADRAATDARFVELGNAILDQLLQDQKRLRSELTTYATAFVIATSHLAEHESLRKEPVFWRRLVATAHASLVTRILGGG